MKRGEQLSELLIARGVEAVPYIVGARASRSTGSAAALIEHQWTGFSEAPHYSHAREIGDVLVDAFLKGSEGGGVDEIHVVYTRFVNMVTQVPDVIRLLPLEVVEGARGARAGRVLPLYEFEPDAESVFDTLLPHYIGGRIYNCLLQATASEQAARQRAMKSASDNASTSSASTPAWPTRPGRPRSPRRSARSSAAPTRSPPPARNDDPRDPCHPLPTKVK